MTSDLRKFHESTTKEINALKDRVRNLIGAQNWSDEGRYKEAVLSNVIKRYLPKNYSVGSGHVVKPASNAFGCEISNQMDIIIYDNSLPLLFSEGNFIITTSAAIHGVIEVKTNIENAGFEKTVNTANENGKFIFYGKKVISRPIFNGIFSYDGYSNGCPESIKEQIRESSQLYADNPNEAKYYIVNHICLNSDFFIKHWRGTKQKYCLYQIRNLSFAYFIGNLLYFVTEKDFALEGDMSFWFPINKELHKTWDVYLQ